MRGEKESEKGRVRWEKESEKGRMRWRKKVRRGEKVCKGGRYLASQGGGDVRACSTHSRWAPPRRAKPPPRPLHPPATSTLWEQS